MLYLIRSWGRGKSILKVGYTANLSKRMDNYYHSNPLFEKLSAREGSLLDEKRLQLYLELSGFKFEKLDEWFIDCPEVLNLFHESQEKISRTLWRYRDSVWTKEDLKKGADKRLRDIYEDLRGKFLHGKYSGSGQIEREYVMLVSQEKMKEMLLRDDFII